MPLYDFNCQDCGQFAILLMKYDAPAMCPYCGSTKMTKQFAPFAIHNQQSSASPTDTAANSTLPLASGHVHTAACSSQCSGSRKADALIEKYLK